MQEKRTKNGGTEMLSQLRTASGVKLSAFFGSDIPAVLLPGLASRLRTLRIAGVLCVGAFVFWDEPYYHFVVEDSTYPSAFLDVFLTFSDHVVIIVSYQLTPK